MYVMGRQEIEAVGKVIESQRLFRYQDGKNGLADCFEADLAKKIGVKSKRLNVIHPNNYSSLMTAEQMKIAADKGAWIELTCDSFGPPINFSWDVFMEAYKTVGADRIIAATDVGIFRSWRPIAALRHFVTGMLTRGIPDSDVEKMIKTNPTELLY